MDNIHTQNRRQVLVYYTKSLNKIVVDNMVGREMRKVRYVFNYLKWAYIMPLKDTWKSLRIAKMTFIRHTN